VLVEEQIVATINFLPVNLEAGETSAIIGHRVLLAEGVQCDNIGNCIRVKPHICLETRDFCFLGDRESSVW
jgi:hypothetical protein